MDMINLWEEGFIPVLKQGSSPGETVYWAGTDKLENFRKNLPSGYTETSITYTYNSFAFREEEFNLNNDRPKILCLGCSHTEGIGLRLEDVWVSHIKLAYPNHDVYNLGYTGGAADTVARILSNTVGVFNPTDIFIFWPSITRYETWKSPSKMNLHSCWNMTEHNMYMLDKFQSYNNFTKNRLIVNLLQEKYKFNLYELENDNMPPEFFERTSDRARDDHYSPTKHIRLFKYFMEKVNASTTL